MIKSKKQSTTRPEDECEEELLHIHLSRGRGEILIPKEIPDQIPKKLKDKLTPENITIKELEKLCNAWGISKKGKTKVEDIILCIQNHFSKKESLGSINRGKKWGQFNTTNHNYILQNMKLICDHKCLIDPCFGDGDLISHAIKLGINPKNVEIKIYDIDPDKKKFKNLKAINQNTLINPVDYTDGLLLMNPPYLSNVQNKLKENIKIYEKYNMDDLFKCYIKTMINNPPKEFIIIVPLNFLSSIRKKDQNLRGVFLEKFTIKLINIFNEQVFNNTTYTVCAIHGLYPKYSSQLVNKIPTHIYPSKKHIKLMFSKNNNFIIGGEIYKLKLHPTIKIGRAVGKSRTNVSNLYLKTIDNGIDKKSMQINLSIKEHNKEKSFGKNSDRSYAWITINPMISKDKQKLVSENFNIKIKEWRDIYDSLFLTNFRDKGRKRISFALAFRIISNLLI